MTIFISIFIHTYEASCSLISPLPLLYVIFSNRFLCSLPCHLSPLTPVNPLPTSIAVVTVATPISLILQHLDWTVWGSYGCQLGIVCSSTSLALRNQKISKYVLVHLMMLRQFIAHIEANVL